MRSRLGGRVASAANIEGKEVVVHDGRILGSFQGVGFPVTLSRDGKSLAFRYQPAGQMPRIWRDGVSEEARFDRVERPLLGTSLIYAAEDSRGHHLVVGATTLGPFEEMGQPVLSADGSTLAFWDGEHLRVGDRRYPTGVDSPTTPALSDDGRLAAFGLGQVLVHAERRIPLPKRPWSAFISADGLHAGALLRDGVGIWGWFRNRLEGPWQGILAASISPRGDRVAYVVLGEGGRWVVVDGRRDGPYEWAGAPLVWNPEGTKLAFGAATGERLLWRVLDFR